MKEKLAEVTSAAVERNIVHNLKHVIGELYHIKIVQVFRELLARVVDEIPRISCVSK